jgi:hypothetical protein
MAARPETLAGSRLAQLARREAKSAAAPAEPRYETCEMCDAPIAPEHRHMIDLRNRELMCACQACSVLFDRDAAGGGHFRLVPDRRLRLDGFEMTDLTWEHLRLPVEMVFFFENSAEGRVMAFYPSPMGPTESQLQLEAWREIEERNPLLATMEPDVEALLVNRTGEEPRQWLVPIDECYSLVGLIRTRWRGLSGGKEVWEEIRAFFDDLDRRSKPGPADTRTKSDAGAEAPAEGS